MVDLWTGHPTRTAAQTKQKQVKKKLKLWRFQMNPGDVRLHVLCVQNIKHIKHISGLKMCSGSPLEPCSLIHVWKCLFRPSSPYLVRAFHAALTTSRLRHGCVTSGSLFPFRALNMAPVSPDTSSRINYLSSIPSSFWFIPLNIMWTEVKLWL